MKTTTAKPTDLHSADLRPASDGVREKAVTLATVAKAVGITKTAASYALSGKGEVSPATRERVIQAARELGYRPNPHAQRLSAGLCRDMVGLYSFTLDLGVATLLVSELHHLLQLQGFEAPVYTYGHFRGQPGDYKYLLESVCRQGPEGIIFSSVGLPDDAVNVLNEYCRIGGKVVCVQLGFKMDCDQVVFDRDENTYRAARVLLEAGHRKIGFCNYGVHDPQGDRRRGFIRALKEYGAQPDEKWFFEAHEHEIGGVRLAEEFLALKQRPTALCIVNDALAATFVHQLWRAGIRVPDEVSVVSMDDLPAAEGGIVRLTSVQYPYRQIAKTAVEWMMQRVRKEYSGEPRKAVFPGEVVERESVRCIKS